MDRWMSCSEVHQCEHECEFGDVDLADPLCPVYKFPEVSHGRVRVCWTMVEADLHHTLYELYLRKATALFVAPA